MHPDWEQGCLLHVLVAGMTRFLVQSICNGELLLFWFVAHATYLKPIFLGFINFSCKQRYAYASIHPELAVAYFVKCLYVLISTVGLFSRTHKFHVQKDGDHRVQ